MPSSQTETAKLFAGDIAAYSDAEVDQYLEANGRCVKVEDPENLPEDFIQRLRSNTAPSRPIDLDYVSARLDELPVDRDPLPQRYSSESSTTSIDEEESCRRNLEEETGYYHKLINDGGRPSHPIGLGYDVAKNMEEYREILPFWNPHCNPSDEYGWMVFAKQEHKWKQFRESQGRMRTDGRFAAYNRGLHKRLASHEFERSFQLNEDPDRQDKLATWSEYLGFEYVEYDKHANIMMRLQQQYNEAWKKLVDCKVLTPFETAESLWTPGIGFQLKSEETQAKKAVESAISIMQSAEKVLLEAKVASLSKLSFSQLEQKLSAARSKLVTVTKSLERISRRRSLISDFHDQTKGYEIAKGNVNRQSILLRWILQQVPLIEIELNQAKVTENNSTDGNGKRQRSFKRNRADDRNEEPASKRLRQDGKNHILLESKTRTSTVQEVSSTRHARQTRSSSILPLWRLSDTKSDTVKSVIVPNNNMQVRTGRRHTKFSLDSTLDSGNLRRSSRPSRPPERYQ
ncbi:ankyrin 23 unc44 protein [Rutstroemia sp. NJR-2017a BBW]|nr:ankyrin 23 unc44 protein [Rutstroemia sp. NJR-2017a BBW]